MTDPKRPFIDLGDVRNLVCPAHERALALDPSVNSIAFPLEVFQAAMADDRMAAACHAGTPDEDLALVGPFLQRVAPVCEWISKDAVAAAWQKARELGRGSRA